MPPPAAFSRPQRWFAALIAILFWGGLALQLWLIIIAARGMGVAWPFAVVVFCFFLTVQITTVGAIVASLAAGGVMRWPVSGRIASAVVAYLLVGGGIFFIVLRPYFMHTGAQAFADAILHYVNPLLYALFWFVAVPKGDLRWRDAVYWLIYPFLYLLCVLTFARWSKFYPYPFVDVSKLGIYGLAVNVVVLTFVFLIGGLAIVAIGRWRTSALDQRGA